MRKPTGKTTTTSFANHNHNQQNKQMKPRIRQILERAIEDGIAYGYHRAHKYTETPDADLMQERISYGIWLEIDAIFAFDEEVEE